MTVVNTNVKALFAQNSLQVNNRTLTNAMQQLSTGSRINSANDDAAGLAIGTRMSADLRGMSVAIRNANDGISMMQTAEGALGEISNMLQRMRDLATQSATGSLTASNRQALQAETEQLISEIDNVSRTTNFNGIQLLDGTATDMLIQTGVKEGDTVGVRITEASAASLGIGSRASLTATGFFNASAGSLGKGLASGDLQINGVNIRATGTADDNLSYGDNASSSVAKVAAINSHAAETGVTAKVLTNVAQGSEMSSNATSTGTITINGVATSSFSTTTDLGTNRADVVKYINQISAQTGVTAVDTGSATHGVQLHAADGRNITVLFSSLSADGTGVSAQGVHSGGYTLTSETGDPIVISQGVAASADLSKAGLAAGTYEANVSAATTTARSVASAGGAPSTSTTGLLNAGVLKINGIDIRAAVSADDTASDITATSSTKAGSAIAIAAAINASSGSTGVTAKANVNLVKGTSFTAGTVASAFYINGVDISTGTTLSSSSTRQDAADQINKFTGRTGVVATDNGAGITLTAEDGRNISLSGTAADSASLGILGSATNQAAGATAASAITTYAKISLFSDRQFKVESGSDGNTSFGKLGFKTGTFGGADNGMKVEDVDISTQQGASSSITALDVALDQVSLNRSNLGAFQNRLTAAVDNLSTQSTNLAEAKGRIMDTDYAKATTELARAQIVQQAATAMLAQANQQPQMVLSLLQ
jgi:flagellin